ncbi:putative eukaryotic translation initiation factor 3 subunit [Chytridium lagenaria]|nr:putative eukaryotic translation initiation factor 3 subunit [Chytridium lagenaria]
MRPILLHGHTRSLTRIKYNTDGDLLFSSSKDSKPKRLGTYNGHNGTVWDFDVTYNSRYLLTGSADNTLKMWEVETGRNVFTWKTKSAVRAVAYALGDEYALYVTDATMGQQCTIHIIGIEADPEDHIIRSIPVSGSKATVAATIYTGHEDGSISIWDAESGERLKQIREHTGAITDLQFAKDKSHFISSSKDNTARELKKFVTERPVNSAALSPIRPHIVLGGGQDAMNVTTTTAKGNKFEARFFHVVFEDEIGRVKGHFGPINTLAFHPNGRSFASGGEDGFIRVHHMDDDYFEFKYDDENFEDLP